MEQIEKGKYICEMIDQLIDEDDEFIKNKTRLYSKYILRLNKEYVDSINSDLYEDCKNYLKKFSSNEENLDMRNLRITGI